MIISIYQYIYIYIYIYLHTRGINEHTNTKTPPKKSWEEKHILFPIMEKRSNLMLNPRQYENKDPYVLHHSGK